MKNLTILLLLSSFCVFSQIVKPKPDTEKIKTTKGAAITDNEKKYLVGIMITKTSCCASGIPLPKEVLEECKTPKPFAKKKVYIKKGKINSFDSEALFELISDSLGKIQFELPPGKYFIVDSLKKDSKVYDNIAKKYAKPEGKNKAIDKTCLTNWYETPDLVFEIKDEDMKNLTLDFYQPCDYERIPCMFFEELLPN